METKPTSNWVVPAGILGAALLIVIGLAVWMPGFTTPNGQTAPQDIVANVPGNWNAAENSKTIGSVADYTGTLSFAADETGTIKRLISVTGSVTKTVTPDQAIITLSVETLDKSASKSQSDNANTSTAVVNALKAAGVADADLKTVGYSLNEEFEWNEISRKSESTGYRTTHTYQVTLHDLTKTGSIIDAASNAGANRIQQVSFTLSQAKEDELRIEALKDASQNARTKAESIGTGLGIALGQVYSASENSNYSTPYYYKTMGVAEGMMDSAPAPSTPIQVGDVEFTATVSVQFEIQ